MSRHKVKICGVNTADINVLSSDEQINLFKRYQAGDMEAKEELINGNLKLILAILRKHSGRCENMDDLFQVGTVGLIKAIDNFDLNYDVKFSTYAVPMIQGEIKRYLRDNSTIRISRSIKDMAYKILKVKEELTAAFGREPTPAEMAKKMYINEYEIADALNSLKDIISMSQPIYNDGGDVIFLEDQIGQKEGYYDLETKIALRDALDKLKRKEKYIIVQRYLIGKTQMELSDEIGISQAQISRLEKSGLSHLKKYIK